MFAVLDGQGNLREVFSDLERAEGHALRAADRQGKGVSIDPNCAVTASANEDAGIPLAANPALPNASSAELAAMAPAEQAYYRTRLPEICGILYGTTHLTSGLVATLSLPEALERVRSALPQSKSFDDPATASRLLLKVNAKLQHSPVIDRTKYISKGLALVPHQLGMRVPEARDLNERPAKAGPPGWPQLALSGATTLCAFSTRECRASCLAFSGQNEVPQEGSGSVSAHTPYFSKMSLTAALYRDPAAFARLLLANIQKHFTYSSQEPDVFPYVRLNVLSDIPWERLFPDLIHTDLALQPVKGKQLSRGMFYDYTKIPNRRGSDLYDLTYSYSGSISSEREMQACLRRGQRVAVVFVQQEPKKATRKSATVPGLPEWTYAKSGGLLLKKLAVQQGKAAVYPWKFLGREVLSGDVSDIRPQDPEGYVVGLTYKPARIGYVTEDGKTYMKAAARLEDIGSFVVRVREIDGKWTVAETPEQTPAAQDTSGVV